MDHDSQGHEIEDLSGEQMRHDWQELFEEGASFVVCDAAFLEPPNRTYSIFDRFGGHVELSLQEALNVLEWLSEQRIELLRFIHNAKEQEARAKPECMNEQNP